MPGQSDHRRLVAALAIEYDCELISADRDFAKFPDCAAASVQLLEI